MAFTQSAVPVDPTTVVLTVRDGTHFNTVYTGVGATIIKDSVGNYHADILANAIGIWSYRWEGQGAVVAAVENRFNVNRSII